jgi:hypothetical protein
MQFIYYIILTFPLLLINTSINAYSITFIGVPSLVLNNDGSLQAKGVLGQVDKNVNVLLKTSSGKAVFDCDLIIFPFGPAPASYSSQNLQNGTFNMAPDTNNMINFDLVISKPIAKYSSQDQCQANQKDHPSNQNGINIDRTLKNATYNGIVLSVQYFDDPATDILTKTWDEIKIPPS